MWFSSPFFSCPIPLPFRSWREELNNLQVNVEFLSSRIDSATASVAPPVEGFTYETPNVVEKSPDPITSSTHSSPQNSSVTYANLSQPEHTVDDSANYAIINDTSNLNDSPPLARSSSIKYVNDADDEPIYYNEPPVFTEQPSYYEQPGKDSRLPPSWFYRHQTKIQHLKYFNTSNIPPSHASRNQPAQYRIKKPFFLLFLFLII